jgi:hypothetical protein
MLKITLSTFLVLTISLTTTFGQRMEKIFLDKNDSTKNCYTIIYPPKNIWTGFIFIIPGFGETATEVLEQTDLPKLSAQNGLLTIIPTFQDGVLSFGVDSLSLQAFDNIFKDVISKHKLADKPFYIGGFSIGGSSAIKIAETSKVKPKAVFAIDPPLDFERFYNSSKRNLRLSVGIEPNQESVYMIDRIEKEMEGTPQTVLTNFYKISPYSFSDTTQTAIKGLIETPLRIYSEPDVNWWIKERGADFTSMNISECSAMINELNRLGNQNADLITTQNKGYRKPDNRRHPHSWSIVDNDELIKWLLKQK